MRSRDLGRPYHSGRWLRRGHSADDEHPLSSRREARSTIDGAACWSSPWLRRSAIHRGRRGVEHLPWRAIFIIVIPVILLISAACRPEMHRAAPSDGARSEPVAVRVDRTGVVRAGNVPESGRCGRGRRSGGRRGRGAGRLRRGQSDRRIGVAALLRMVVPSFLLAADPSGLAA